MTSVRKSNASFGSFFAVSASVRSTANARPKTPPAIPETIRVRVLW
jgi:hypothetical protein